MRFTKRRIEIRTRNDLILAVDALVHAEVAVHKNIAGGHFPQESYCITHIPTGYKVGNGASQRQAKARAEIFLRLATALGFPLQVTDPVDAQTHIQQNRAAYRLMIEDWSKRA